MEKEKFFVYESGIKLIKSFKYLSPALKCLSKLGFKNCHLYYELRDSSGHVISYVN